MGEYWKPVNLTRREFVHPHKVDCGLKLPEWNWDGSPVWRRINALIAEGRWSADDDIRALSDYGGEFRLKGEPTQDTYDETGGFDNVEYREGDHSGNLYREVCDAYKDVSQ
jgi:hypothetical protein